MGYGKDISYTSKAYFGEFDIYLLLSTSVIDVPREHDGLLSPSRQGPSFAGEDRVSEVRYRQAR